MAEDTSNDVTWLLEIERQHLDYLGPIRHWSQLKMAASPDFYWVMGLKPDQLELPEIKSIPFKNLYYMQGVDAGGPEQGRLLFPPGGLVPVKKLPDSLLWTPLERGLSISLPSFNHNYFGITEKLNIRLVPSGKEEEPAAILTSIARLQAYILTAPAVRLRPLTWVIIDDQALILGKPLLPLPGDSYWQRGNFLLPAGLDWEWTTLTETLNRDLNPDRDCWLLWDKTGRYLPILKEQCRPLSISSFRLSIVDLL
jgi:hypothetical protein